jgi:murein DD-endopeptidase MepM/ murein hydrolase activator NlpD
VYSPLDGTVVQVEQGYPDLEPGQQDQEHPLGNHVVIRHHASGTFIFLIHLQQGSLTLRKGDEVRSGEPVGRVGNSGASPEPHLHVHAIAGDATAGKPVRRVPLVFDGQFLRRNSLVRAQHEGS